MFRVFAAALLGIGAVSACSGGHGGGGGSTPIQPQSQSIAFAQAGPLNKFADDAPFSDLASGGAGSGAITYASSAPGVATVDTHTGLATIVGTGTTQITASKAADAFYEAAQASYQLLVAPRSVSVTAWVGAADSEVSFAALPLALDFTRSSDFSCDPANYSSCANGAQTQTSTNILVDQVATLFRPAMYWLKHGSAFTTGIVAPEQKFDNQVDPGVVAFQGRLWVVGDPSNEVWSSADGLNWRLETANPGIVPGRSNFKLVALNNALWIIGGLSGSTYLNDVWTSADGKTWNKVIATTAFPARGYFGAAAFNGRIWVAGGWTGAIDLDDVWSSPDGINWTQATAAATGKGREQHELLTFNGKLWLVSGWSNGFPLADAWSSTDGVTWTAATVTAAFGPRFAHRVVSDGTKMWLTAGRDAYQSAQHDVWSSPDGATWTEVTATAEFSVRSDHGSVFFNDALWVIGGGGNEVWTSSGGQHWSKKSLSVRIPGAQAIALTAYQGKVWVLDERLALWASADGIGWTQQTQTAPGSQGGPALLALSDRLLLIGGWQANQAPLSYYRGAWQSLDGQTWSQVSNPVPFAPLNFDQAIVFNGKVWVFAGSSADPNVPEVWSSPDGANWTRVVASAPYGPRTAYVVMTYNNRLWVIGGNSPTTSLNDVWSSPDGASWTKVASTGLPARTFVPGLTLQTIMCIYGDDFIQETLNDAWCSSDGATWQQKPGNAPFGPLVNLNDTAFGIGNSTPLQESMDIVWKSTDGVAWRAGYQNTMQFP